MRQCHYCAKPLPEGAPRTQLFCRAEIGLPRCRDLARKRALKAKSRPDSELITVHRHAPRGAVGYRLRLEAGERTWIGPRLGVKSHKNAAGKMTQGDFYHFDETPRVPKTTTYRIDYVDQDGLLLLPSDDSPSIRLMATGGDFKDKPSQSLREKQRILQTGRPPPAPRKRIYELARELGILVPQLLEEITKIGFKVANVQNSLAPQQVDLILRHYAEQVFPRTRTFHPRLPMPTTQLLHPAPAAPIIMNQSLIQPALDESLPVPPLIQPEHAIVHAELRAIVESVELEEQKGRQSVEQLTSEVQCMGRQVDISAGLMPLQSRTDNGGRNEKEPA